MVLVDTSVWIELFNGRACPQLAALETLLDAHCDLCVCGVILTEVLQGIRRDRDFRRVQDRFEALLFLPMTREIHVEAARLYRTLRRKGVTIRTSVDCMIAAIALAYDVALLHNDRDFILLDKHTRLKTIDPAHPLRHLQL